MVLYSKSSQEYPVNCEVHQGFILGPTLFLLYIYDLPHNFIRDFDIYADDTTLFSKRDQASNLWEQLKSATELESDLSDTVDWATKWLVDFNAVKPQLVFLHQSNNTGAIEVKMDGSILEEKSSGVKSSGVKMLGLNFSSKLIGALTFSIAKISSQKIGTLICSVKVLSPQVLIYP